MSTEQDTEAQDLPTEAEELGGDIYEMSDEDFLNTPPEDPAPADDSDDDEESAPADSEESDEQDEDTDDISSDDLDEESEKDDEDPIEDLDEDGEEEKDEEPEQEETDQVNYKAEFEKLTAPFRANNKEMSVDNVDDAIRLMQMGANYNRKMAGLKPSMKILKMLEKQELLDEGKLSYLIDLNKGNPDAVKKLIKDRKIDVMDLQSGENDSEYKSSDYGVTDNEVDLDTVIDDLKGTSKTYSKTIDIVGNQWDDDSKQIVADQPHLMRDIDAQVANGVYDRVSTEVEKERSFGRLGGMSDIEAYQTVGVQMAKAGRLADLFPGESEESPATEKPKPAPKKPEKDEQARRAKRKAASPTKQSAKKGAEPDYSPLALSDEEFLKQADSRLM